MRMILFLCCFMKMLSCITLSWYYKVSTIQITPATKKHTRKNYSRQKDETNPSMRR